MISNQIKAEWKNGTFYIGTYSIKGLERAIQCAGGLKWRGAWAYFDDKVYCSWGCWWRRVYLKCTGTGLYKVYWHSRVYNDSTARNWRLNGYG